MSEKVLRVVITFGDRYAYATEGRSDLLLELPPDVRLELPVSVWRDLLNVAVSRHELLVEQERAKEEEDSGEEE